MWSIWRDRNERSFDNLEKLIELLKALVFNTLYLWTTSQASLIVANFHEFHSLFPFSSLVLSCILLVYLCFTLINKITLTLSKTKDQKESSKYLKQFS